MQVALDEARQALVAAQAEAASLRQQLQDQSRDAAALGVEAVRAGERLQDCRRELESVRLPRTPIRCPSEVEWKWRQQGSQTTDVALAISGALPVKPRDSRKTALRTDTIAMVCSVLHVKHCVCATAAWGGGGGGDRVHGEDAAA